MSKQNLGKARGLNSIADPSEFRGKSARPPRKTRKNTEESSENTHKNPELTRQTPAEAAEDAINLRNSDLRDNDRGGDASASSNPAADADRAVSTTTDNPVVTEVEATPKRRGRPPAVGQRRIRRELSVPVVVADAVEQTGINPADLVMNAYRRHSDDVYTGDGARLAARGRKRLRISLSDGDFDKISRLGEARNWNRSETVSVLLSLDLLAESSDPAPVTGD